MGNPLFEDDDIDDEDIVDDVQAPPTQKQGLSESHANQLKVLRAMATAPEGARGADAVPENRLQLIPEIAARAGFPDDKEVLRFLYILEGQKLVTPSPEGDFTAKHWKVTREGVRVWNSISRALQGKAA